MVGADAMTGLERRVMAAVRGKDWLADSDDGAEADDDDLDADMDHDHVARPSAVAAEDGDDEALSRDAPGQDAGWGVVTRRQRSKRSLRPSAASARVFTQGGAHSLESPGSSLNLGCGGSGCMLHSQACCHTRPCAASDRGPGGTADSLTATWMQS